MSTITKRLMIFADGENLVARYQAMLAEGKHPKQDTIHDQDTFVWNKDFAFTGNYTIWRATYYTSTVGDDTHIKSVADKIRATRVLSDGFIHFKHENPWQARVFKQVRGTARSKGVDIKLAVDVLSNTFNKNTDAIMLCSGDGDYAPLVEECIRQGQQVLVAAFSNGLSPSLCAVADQYFCLDQTYFE